MELGKVLHSRLPKGPQCVAEDFLSKKWEYAIVLKTLLAELEAVALSTDSMSAKSAYLKFQEIHNDYRHPCHYIGSFPNFQEYLPDCLGSKFKVTHELILEMQGALELDIVGFNQAMPEYLDSIQAWKRHETYRMLKEMDIKETNEYELLLPLYDAFKKQRTSCSSLISFNIQNVRVISCYMTLLERIQLLENRVKQLETVSGIPFQSSSGDSRQAS